MFTLFIIFGLLFIFTVGGVHFHAYQQGYDEAWWNGYDGGYDDGWAEAKEHEVENWDDWDEGFDDGWDAAVEHYEIDEEYDPDVTPVLS
jgi:hypothetical protein